ncbi:MAG: bacteriohemerythrin [Desulfovibrionaceae bacterium]
MAGTRKIHVTNGVYYVEIPDAGLRILCGCPADSLKHLMRHGLIVQQTVGGRSVETGPNAILLSDTLIQGGAFSNLAEFPVLQMLYRQGMILPGHPNNTGVKPLIIGSEAQVRAQMAYIHRGNYGLLTKDEIMATGVDEASAEDMMRLKLRFAFGAIREPEALLEACVVENDPTPLRGGASIRRIAFNVFEISHGNETVTVDLNLPHGETYPPPYFLGFSRIEREFFAVIHSGEGDGWDMNRPCMGSVLMFQGRIYLIDAGPNILYSLRALGIGINEIDGIFHTHGHDDHFNGMTTLLRADHKLKYYATPLVRASVFKKLAVLTATDEEDFNQYFDFFDLQEGEWNTIAGLEVKPINSPHPVETTIFMFRALAGNGYRTYAHFADIVSFEVLEKFITDDPAAPGVSQHFYEQTHASYLQPADLKKLDIGGGLIHGNAEDFRNDPSAKIILSHTALPLTNRQKELGSGAPFGMVDRLIPAYQDYLRRNAFHYLRDYFPSVNTDQILTLTNNPVETWNPESILMRADAYPEMVYLILTGNVEMIESATNVHGILSAGALVGEFEGVTATPAMETYRACNFVNVLCVPRMLYYNFIKNNNLFEDIEQLHARRDFLMKTQLFSENVSFPVLNAIASALREIGVPEGDTCEPGMEPGLYMVKSGMLRCMVGDRAIDVVPPGDCVGGSTVLYGTPSIYAVRAAQDSVVCHIPPGVLRDIPIVRWKLLENHKRRTALALSFEQTGIGIFQWRKDFEVGVDIMDSDHRRLFEIADSLHDAIRMGVSRAPRFKIFNALIAFANEHFAREEAFMREHGYPEIENHHRHHERLIEEVEAYRGRLETGEVNMDAAFVTFFKDWLINHILANDHRFGAFFNQDR